MLTVAAQIGIALVQWLGLTRKKSIVRLIEEEPVGHTRHVLPIFLIRRCWEGSILWKLILVELWEYVSFSFEIIILHC